MTIRKKLFILNDNGETRFEICMLNCEECLVRFACLTTVKDVLVYDNRTTRENTSDVLDNEVKI